MATVTRGPKRALTKPQMTLGRKEEAEVKKVANELLDALRLYAETKLDIVDCILLAKGTGDDREVFSFDAAIRSRASAAD